MSIRPAPQENPSDPEPQSSRRGRRPWIAGLLSLLTPGLGHLYNGRPLTAVMALSALYSLAVLWAFVGYGTFAGLLLGLALAVALYLGIAVHAMIDTRRHPVEVIPWHSRWYGLIAMFVAVSVVLPLLNLLVVPTIRYRTYSVPTNSMEPTVRAGESFYVDTWAFRSAVPQRPDVVVAKVLSQDSEHLRRIIAGPGERVRIENQQVYVDGVPLEEPYKQHAASPGAYVDPLRDTYPPVPRLPIDPEDPGFSLLWYEDHLVAGDVLMPDGQYFGLGDNRDSSSDSRYVGPLDAASVRGRALYIYWSDDYSRIGQAIE